MHELDAHTLNFTEKVKRRHYYYYYYELQLSFHSMVVVLTLVTNRNKYA